MSHRYLIGHAHVGVGHVVRDSDDRMREVFRSGSKSEAIAEAQRLNGFEPVDGSEQTYAEQVARSNGEGKS